MTHSLDLDAYFERIRWGGPTRPGLDTLTGLLRAHMKHIPFENLDVLLGRPVRLDLEGLQEKLVRGRRGGYCFEHGTLFAAVLENLGFRPVRHTARVTLFVPRSLAQRTHMFLNVSLTDGSFVVDPGFGGLAPRAPVPLDGTEVSDGQDSHSVVRDGRFWLLRALSDGKTVDAWATTLDEDYPVDFEMANYFIATHPSSPFVNRIMLRAFIDGGSVSVMNREVIVRRGDQRDTLHLADRRALRDLLAEYFGFDLPELDQVRVPMIPEWG
jgi:N-hydroxyarylamine O-acetyltransferase